MRIAKREIVRPVLTTRDRILHRKVIRFDRETLFTVKKGIALPTFVRSENHLVVPTDKPEGILRALQKYK